MTSNYDDMLFEYKKVQGYIDQQATIKFCQEGLMMCVQGIEFLNKKVDPFGIKLNGWSENLYCNIEKYDNVFERLAEKYSSGEKMAPELELLLMIGGSAFMFHMSNSLLGSPVLSNLVQPNMMGDLMSMMGKGMTDLKNNVPNFKNGPSPGQGVMPPPIDTRSNRKEMRGPNIDPSLFSGTPLANNYPKPPNPMDYNPMRDDDRFSVASSSDSDLSSLSSASSVSIKKRNNKKRGGFELNIK